MKERTCLENLDGHELRLTRASGLCPNLEKGGQACLLWARNGGGDEVGWHLFLREQK